MTKIHLALAAALLSATALPALAVDTKPADATTTEQAATPTPQTADNMPAANTNNAQAGMNDVGKNTAPNTQMAANTQINGNSGGMGISADASTTQRKATHSASQRAKADAAEAETTKQLNQQAAELAKPDVTSIR